MTDAIVIITTTEQTDQAERLAELLVQRKLAACVQILARIKSIYHWQGQVESANESLLIIKTTRAAYATVETAIIESHRLNQGYETPEVIALPIEQGSSDYLSWLVDSVEGHRVG